MEWFNQIFKKFAELQLWAVILIVVLAAASITGLIIVVRKQKKVPEEAKVRKGWDIRTLIIGALCVSLAFVLSYIRIWHMPQGGSVTLASMLPIMVFAYIYGTPKGLVVALAYGLLQMLQDLYIVHWAQAAMDYILAFLSLALAGLFKKSILPGAILACFSRYVFHVLSGVIFFAEYAPEGQNVWVYSSAYNSVVLVEMAIIIFIVLVIPQLRRFINSQKELAR